MRFLRQTLSRAILGSLFVCALVVTQLSAPQAFAKANKPGHLTWHAVVGLQSKDFAIQGTVFSPLELWIDQGDTVTWTANSAEIHTVTFLKPGQVPPPFNGSPSQVNRVGGSHYDGKSYYNSGLMGDFPGLPFYKTYSLTFDVTGDFIYYCLVHPSMIGILHVRPAGTSYPFSQKDYDQQIQQETRTILLDGSNLAREAARKSTNHYVIDGIGDSLAMLMRFYPRHITIHVGDTVTFVNLDSMGPHTVTFGPRQKSNFAPYGNPRAFDGKNPLNSGYLGVNPHWFGTTYKVTFVKAGSYAFRCDLHAYMGMVIGITVQ